MRAPTVDDVKRIAALADPVVRNLQITQCYHELAVAVAHLSGSGANWCTFATWASKQAGQSIRREDLIRTFERLFRGSPEVAAALQIAAAQARQLNVRLPRPDLPEAILQALDPHAAFERAADAVARGNRKVFEEIAREFARYLSEFAADTAFDAHKTSHYCAALRDGDPPDGQRLLREAFTAYCEARFATDARHRAELMLLANFLVGYHEQMRLQPEILEAMTAALGDTEELKRRLLPVLLPGLWLRIRYQLAHLLRRKLPLDVALERLAELAKQQMRAVVTRSLMTLHLPGVEVLRLGRPLTGSFPPDLQQIRAARLLELLGEVDRKAKPAAGAGTSDWGNFDQRIHFIAQLFRLYHDRQRLVDPPFTPEQVATLKAGHRPAGPL